MFKFKAVFLGVTLLFLSNISQGHAEISPQDVAYLAAWRASVHKTDVWGFLNLIKCESRFNPYAIGTAGEVGSMQWLPGRGNAWNETSAYRILHIDIHHEYQVKNPNAVFFDIDAGAELYARGEIFRRIHWFNTYRKIC